MVWILPRSTTSATHQNRSSIDGVAVCACQINKAAAQRTTTRRAHPDDPVAHICFDDQSIANAKKPQFPRK
ncbi:MAG: hypothetical protein CBB97_17305 [Candidatus Endolissoclinum sp. TMED37]|nr:MAG: hypothetical protein CBB97_17305 [Candidatus Endolissoclinum sp. TMED37]